MMNWNGQYRIDWAVYRVNQDTWDDDGRFDGVISASVDRDCTDSVPLLETASMNVTTSVIDEFEDGWYRIVAYIYQDGLYERHPITTQQFQISSDEVDYGMSWATVNGQSALLPAQETAMRDGSYLPKGANGAEWVYEKLVSCLKCPVYLDDEGFTLERYVAYDSGDSILSACWSVLDAGKWCLQIDGDGIVHILKKPVDPMLEVEVKLVNGTGNPSGTTRSDLSLILPGIKRSRGKAGVPNRYIAKDGDHTEIAENNDPTSPSSYQNVGRWIENGVDSSPSYVNGESLWAYSRRKLEEASTLYRSYDYSREYWPGVFPFDILRASAYEYGFYGDLRIAKQKLTLENGIKVQETANEEIKLWRA